MLESSKYDRIKFHKGIQKDFILRVEKKLDLTELEFSEKLKICVRTIRDWKKEKLTMSHFAAKKMSKWSKLSIPKKHEIIYWRLHFQKAGRIGANVKFARYGRVNVDEQYRKEKWKEWWNNVGKYKKPAPGFQTLEKIKIPRKSKLLAEFIGILLGDGHISSYQVGITLSSEEKPFIKYTCEIFKKLFGVSPAVVEHKQKKAVAIIVSRKLLVDFCQKFGFEMGNKVIHQVDIPEWIKKNKVFSKECVRGLVDTDGCFFTHKYIVGGKKYSYFKIAFTSASAPLRESVENILINLGFNVRMSKVRGNNNGRDVRIDDARFVVKYIDEIGSHNSKHLEKIRKWRVAPNGKVAVC